jgi:cell division ATPase FtsA
MFNPKKHIKLVMDIGTLFSKYIVVLAINGEEKYLFARILRTPDGLFDEDGNIKDQKQLEAFLESILDQIQSNRNLNKLDIVTYIGLSYIENIATHVSNPYTENKDFDKELKDLISNSEQYDKEKYSYNYDFKNGITSQLAVCDTMIVGYDKNIINFYLKFFDKRNIFVKSITLSNLAITKALSKKNSIDYEDIEYSLLVDLGASTTEVILLKNGFPLNYFVISMGGNDVTNSLKEYFNYTFEEAEELKVSINEEYCIFQDDYLDLPHNEKALSVIETLKPIFAEWQSKIFQQVSNELKISKIPSIKSIYFAGGSSNIKNLPESISALFQAQYEHINLNNILELEKIKREVDIVYHNLQSFMPVLCHLKVQPLNLITKDYIKSKITKAPKFTGGNTILVLSLALFIGANAFGYIQTANNNQDVKSINTKMDQLKTNQQVEQAKIQKYDALDNKVSIFEDKLKNKIKWSVLMKKVYDSTSQGIQILEIHELGDGQMEISGLALDYNLIGNFGKLLEANGAMQNVIPSNITIENVDVTDGSKYQLKKFYMRGAINPNNLVH